MPRLKGRNNSPLSLIHRVVFWHHPIPFLPPRTGLNAKKAGPARLHFSCRRHPIVAARFEPDGLEVRLATLNFLALYFGQLQELGRAFRFTHKIQLVPAVRLLLHNRPVGIVLTQTNGGGLAKLLHSRRITRISLLLAATGSHRFRCSCLLLGFGGLVR